MTENTYARVKTYMKKYEMIKAHDLVAAGVSGGADSVCLLHILRRLQKEIAFRLLAVHVDHGARADAAADARYVEALCGQLGVPFYLRRVDMNGYAARHRLSAEEAGRVLRYSAFEEVLQQERRSGERGRIAVAHNCNDRAETMLFHMFRGSGLRGLSSIRPVRESVIRPVLCLERKTIEAYLAENGLRCCQDSTNEEDAYTRNRIRHHILPYAEREICAGAAAHMGELAEILADTERYLEAQTRRLYGVYVQEEQPETDGTVQCLWIDSAGLLAEDPVMRKRVLLACMERLTPYRKDITGKHIAGLEQLMTKDGSREIHLPCRLRACKEYDRLCISNVGERALRRRQTGQEQAYGEYTAQIREKQAAGENTAQIKDKQTDGEKAVQTGEKQTAGQMASQAGAVYQIVPPAQIRVPGEGTFVFTLLEKGVGFFEKEQNIPQNRYTKWFDYDKITTSLLLRTRRQGDYMTIDEAMHTKTVKQYMINEKIPKMQRDSMHLLADGSHVLWIPGYRISQKYKVEESTERILEVRLEGGSNGGTNRSVVE